MPPSFFVCKSDIREFAFELPSSGAGVVKPGDTLIGILLCEEGTAGALHDDSIAAGWSEEIITSGSGGTIFVGRRIATSTDALIQNMALDETPGWMIGAVLVYRQLAGVVASASDAIAGEKDHIVPSLTLIAYSDLYLGIVGITTENATVDPPAAAIERLSEGDQGSLRHLEIFELRREVAGATGAQTTVGDNAQDSIVAAIAYAATPLGVVAGNTAAQSLSLVPFGSFGLPSIGV